MRESGCPLTNASPANDTDPMGLLGPAGIAALVSLIVAVSGTCIKKAYDYADQTLLPENDKLAHCYFYCSFVRCTAAVLGPLPSVEAADIIGLAFEEMQGTGLIRGHMDKGDIAAYRAGIKASAFLWCGCEGACRGML